MKKWQKYSVGALCCVLLWGVVFCGMRGSFQLYPLHISFAYFCDHPFYNRLGINPVFNIIKSAEQGRSALPKGLAQVDEQEALAYVEHMLGIADPDSEHPLVRAGMCAPILEVESNEGQGDVRKTNVVLVLMESMAEVNLERTNERGEYLTPYLRSLRERSVYCENAYSAGIHTNNGIVACQYGFVPNFAKTIMGVDAPRFTGLPYYLAQAGFENMVFITGNPQYDNMNAFWRDNNITTIYSQYDYPREARVNNFGVPDSYLFQWGLNKLEEQASTGRPFFATFLTVSNHMPYVIPAAYTSRGETDEERSIACADDAIRQFMETAQETTWGRHTLFILVADHGIAYNSPYEMGLDGNKIPIFLVHPALEPQVIDRPVSQIDLPETVLSMLGIAHENNTLGIDFLHQYRPYAFFVSNEHLGVADSSYFYCFSIQTGREQLYRIGSGENLTEVEPARTASMREYGMNMERVNLMAMDKQWTEPQR